MYEKLICVQNLDLIMRSLKKYGIAIIPSYVDDEELRSLNDEFMKSFSYKGSGLESKHKHPTNEDGMVVRVKRTELSGTDFPVMTKVFGSSFMEDILEKYYAPHDYILNDDIFITHEKPCPTPILPWHHDRVQALKFFIYLKNTTKNDRPLNMLPGP